MRASNFRLRASIYLIIGDLELDMHNDYDFTSVQYDIAKQQVTFTWLRSYEKWVDLSLPTTVKLICEGVTMFSSTPGDTSLPKSESSCLNSFGYQTDESWGQGQFWVDVEPEEHWAWSVQLQSNQEFLVLGEVANVQIDS